MKTSNLLQTLAVFGTAITLSACFDPSAVGSAAEGAMTEGAGSTAAESSPTGDGPGVNDCPSCAADESSSGEGPDAYESSSTSGGDSDGSDASSSGGAYLDETGTGSTGEEVPASDTASTGEGGEPLCGNGRREGDEACDDANGKNFDACTDDCEEATCGYTIELRDDAICPTGVTDFCVPRDYTWTQAACEACSGAACIEEALYNGTVWTSTWNRSYVAEVVHCPLILGEIWPMQPGQIKDAEYCVGEGQVLTP